MHVPVLLEAVLQYLAVRPDGIYVDATCGLGGHTAAIAERLTTGKVIAVDQDEESLMLAQTNTVKLRDKIIFRKARFSQLRDVLDELKIERIDGLLADLGVSRYQLTSPERGFSIMAEGPLDMRMDRSQDFTAADLVNKTPEKELADLIYRLGEEKRARKVARAIVQARPITTTRQLAEVVSRVVPRTGKIHPATRTFMALRRAVNREEEELQALLSLLPDLLNPGGRAVILTYMSLEDRLVKHAFRDFARQGRAKLLTKHVVKPSAEEVRSNPSARSAKLRAIEWIQ